MRILALCILLCGQFLGATALAQQENPHAQTAFCDFEDQQQISVRYNNSVAGSQDEPHNGKVWLPAGSPLTLFTAVPLTLNQAPIAPGAYSIYIIPNKKNWTLIVNRNVTAANTYDEKQDVARSSKELGEVDSPPKQLEVSFAHTAPKQCSIRLYYGKIGAFAEFNEQ